MAMFKIKEQDDWKKNYILEFNEMRDAYEKKLQKKQMEIDTLKVEIIRLKNSKHTLKPKEKQITDMDIQSIRDLRLKGLSYSEISAKIKWSKATVSRVLNGLYD